MKTSKLISVTFAAGLAGVVLAKLGSASLLASLPGDKLFVLGAGLAVLGLAAYDYSRRRLPLMPRTRNVIHPTLPVSWRAPDVRPEAATACAPASHRSAA